jgi:hypothetical protein
MCPFFFLSDKPFMSASGVGADGMIIIFYVVL